MLDMITVTAPAKINLYLEVSSKRADGYHNIESVMQTVTLFDRITLTKHPETGQKCIKLVCSDDNIPCDERNLVWRAAVLFFDTVGINCYDLSAELTKKIPSSAGLGGGSSDAAAVLKALNSLYEVNLDSDSLREIGAVLGADIPFLIDGGISVVRGIGEIINPCHKMPDCCIAIACAGEGVSTPWAYGLLDETYDFSVRKVSAQAFAEVLCGGELHEMCGAMTNIFESVVLPERETARLIGRVFDESGAVRSMMSGSGPSMIGIFDRPAFAQAAAVRLLEYGIMTHIVEPYYPQNYNF